MLFPDLTALIMKSLVIITQNYENKAYLCSRKSINKEIKKNGITKRPDDAFQPHQYETKRLLSLT